MCFHCWCKKESGFGELPKKNLKEPQYLHIVRLTCCRCGKEKVVLDYDYYKNKGIKLGLYN